MKDLGERIEKNTKKEKGKNIEKTPPRKSKLKMSSAFTVMKMDTVFLSVLEKEIRF